MALPYLDKLRGVRVRQNGVDVANAGRVYGLDFLESAVTYDPTTGYVTIEVDSDSAAARRVFTEYSGTLAAGDYAFVNVPVAGTQIGDLCGVYKSSTSGITYPAIVLLVEYTDTGVIRVRVWNTGATELVIGAGTLTFYVQSKHALPAV